MASVNQALQKLAFQLHQQAGWIAGLALVAVLATDRALLPALALLLLALLWPAIRRPALRTPADLAIGALLLLLPVTLWVTALPQLTGLQVQRLLVGIALFYVLSSWASTPARLALVLAGSALLGSLLAASAFVSVSWSAAKLPFIPRWLYAQLSVLVADTVNANVMAGSLVLLLPPTLAGLLFGARSLGRRSLLLCVPAVLAMAGVLLLTQSRGALLALLAVLLVLLALRWRWGCLGLLFVMLPGAMILPWQSPVELLDQLSASPSMRTLDYRLEIWSRALLMLHDFPLTGIGMGSFRELSLLLYPLFLSPEGQPHTHNLLLQIGVDLGLPGLVAWLAIFFVICACAWQTYRYGRRVGDGRVAGIGAGLLCSQVALFVHGLTDAVTWGMVRPAVLVWALWGITVAAWRLYVGVGPPELAGAATRGAALSD